MEPIRSHRHPLVARCRRLARGRPDDDPAMLLDGWHLLGEALAAGLDVEIVAVADDEAGSDAGAPRLIEAARLAGARVVRVAAAVLGAMSPVRTPSGVVALARQPRRTLDDALRPPPAMVFVAVDVQDPGNLGAIVRAVDAAGGTGVIAAGASADPWGWKAVRGAMGSAFRLPVVRDADAVGALRTIGERGVRLLATGTRSETPLFEQDLRGPIAVALGSEGRGLDAGLVALADGSLAIPMRPGVDSLNVATAAAIIAYEARRQRSVG